MMELSLAVGQSLDEVLRISRHAVDCDRPRLDFWLDELLVEIGAYEAAINQVIGDERVKSPWLRSLRKSVDVEIHGILALAKGLQVTRHPGHEWDVIKLTAQLVARQRRLAVKGRYLVSHLKDYFSPAELRDLGDAFADERAANSRAVHTMAFGG